MTVYEPTEENLGITVRELFDDPALELDARLVAGHCGVEREVRHRRIQKSGLVLVGHLHGLVPTRIQVVGETELSYLESLDDGGRRQAAAHLFASGLACVVVTRGVDTPVELVEAANLTDTPLFVCVERSSRAITSLHECLDERLAPRTQIHGVLVDVFEVGVLLLGQSGIGKSECALDLVMRGHRIVADDIVECDYRPPGMIFGEPNDMLRHHMEVRGLGILDIMELYGVTAIRERKRIDLVVKLDAPKATNRKKYDRLGLDDRWRDILGVPIREVLLPVRPGRNMSSIIEIAARHELLRQAGHDSAKEFIERVEAEARGEPMPPKVGRSRLQRERDGTAPPLESSVPPPVSIRPAKDRDTSR